MECKYRACLQQIEASVWRSWAPPDRGFWSFPECMTSKTQTGPRHSSGMRELCVLCFYFAKISYLISLFSSCEYFSCKSRLVGEAVREFGRSPDSCPPAGNRAFAAASRVSACNVPVPSTKYDRMIKGIKKAEIICRGGMGA